MPLELPKVKEWMMQRKGLVRWFATGGAVACLMLLAHGNHFAERMINLAFKVLVGATGTVMIGILVIAIVPIGWVYKGIDSGHLRHAALRGHRRRMVLQKLALWVNARAKRAASFIAGIALVALANGDVLAAFRIFTGALWFCALATFVESIADSDRKLVRYATGISLGYLVGMTLAPHLYHLS